MTTEPSFRNWIVFKARAMVVVKGAKDKDKEHSADVELGISWHINAKKSVWLKILIKNTGIYTEP